MGHFAAWSVCVYVCVCAGGTAVHGAGQQLRKRGAYVETAVATPLPHMTQLPVKTTRWAFPYCPPPLILFPLVSRLCQHIWRTIFFVYISFPVLKSTVYYKQDPLDGAALISLLLSCFCSLNLLQKIITIQRETGCPISPPPKKKSNYKNTCLGKQDYITINLLLKLFY